MIFLKSILLLSIAVTYSLVAMADGQVTGGYLRVLSLDSQEMNFLAQQTTGKKLRLDFQD